MKREEFLPSISAASAAVWLSRAEIWLRPPLDRVEKATKPMAEPPPVLYPASPDSEAKVSECAGSQFNVRVGPNYARKGNKVCARLRGALQLPVPELSPVPAESLG